MPFLTCFASQTKLDRARRVELVKLVAPIKVDRMSRVLKHSDDVEFVQELLGFVCQKLTQYEHFARFC